MYHKHLNYIRRPLFPTLLAQDDKAALSGLWGMNSTLTRVLDG